MSERSRREFLCATGGTVAPTVLALNQSSQREDRGDWTVVETPTQRTLHDVADTTTGAFVVGSNGLVLERGDDGWSVVTDAGPTGNGNNLSAAATTTDGRRLWMAGASGVVGEYDPEADALTSRSAPDGVTNTFTDVAVTGAAGDATVYLADSSGQIHRSEENGREGTWTHTTPGSGAEIAAISMVGAAGVVVDQNGSLFETTDGETWTSVDAPAFDETLHDVELRASGTVVLAGAAGTVAIGAGGEWEQESAANDALYDVEVGDCGCVHAVGASGTVLHRRGHGTPPLRTLARAFDWWTRASPTGESLNAIALADPHVAVGASGTVLEREH